MTIGEDPSASPEEVAAYVKYEGVNSDRGQIAFMEALQTHGDDPEWLAEFYTALGPDAASALIAHTTDPVSYQYAGAGGSAEYAEAQTQAVLDSLQTLHDAGYLDQQSLEFMLDGLYGDAIVYASTEIFANADPGLQELFFNYASQSDNPDWNAGALHVLNTMSPDKQQTLLAGLGDGLDGFIASAMEGERDVPLFADAVRLGNATPMAFDDGLIEPLTYGGIETLLDTANGVTVYYHAKTVVPDFDTGLQVDLFSAVSTALESESVFDKFIDNAAFKDELSILFINNTDQLLHTYAPDGAFQPGTIEGLVKFFEITLFTPNAGAQREPLMEHVVLTMGDVGDASAAPPLSQAEYEELHGGWSQMDHVEVMGGLQAMVLQAADNQKTYLEGEILSDQQQREAMIGFVAGMAFAFVPGGSAIMKGLQAEGGSWLSQVPGTVAAVTYDQGTSQLKEASQDGLIDLLSGAGENQESLAEVEAFMTMFKDTILATNAALPNGEEGELNLRSAFQAAFAFYGDLIDP